MVLRERNCGSNLVPHLKAFATNSALKDTLRNSGRAAMKRANVPAPGGRFGSVRRERNVEVLAVEALGNEMIYILIRERNRMLRLILL